MNRPLLAVFLLAGCVNDQGIYSSSVDAIAVTLGDFDEVAAPLDRAQATYTEYDGAISSLTWDPTRDTSGMSLTVETLVANEDELSNYDLVFMASGTRGLGDRVYNGIDDDDDILLNQEYLDNVEAWVRRGNVLVCTDCSYDLIEAIWPEAATFLGDDDTPDDAQRGALDHYISADVQTDGLVNAIGSDTANIDMDYSNWAIIDDVSDDAVVLLTGDAAYRDTTGEGDIPLEDIPLMFSYPVGNGGLVVYASFNLGAQNGNMIDPLLTEILGEYNTETESEAPVND